MRDSDNSQTSGRGGNRSVMKDIMNEANDEVSGGGGCEVKGYTITQGTIFGGIQTGGVKK